MVSQPAKLKSKLPCEAVAVARGATVNSTTSQFDPNTNGFLNYFFRLSRLPHMSIGVL